MDGRDAGLAAGDLGRGRYALADIEGDWIIEINAYGRSAFGADLWLADPIGRGLAVKQPRPGGPPRRLHW